MIWIQRGVAVAVLAGGMGLAGAQSIYSCVDSTGHKHTSDRPIAACLDREQQVLNPSGTVRRKIGPSLTAQERAAQEAQEKRVAEEQARLAEEKRRDRALLTRYPSRSVHDRERTEALLQVDVVIKAAQNRIGELGRQRQAIDAELEFYKSDPSRAPASLRRQVDENVQSLSVQNRFIAEQESEKKRISARFDEELVKLRQLWALQAPAAASLPVGEKK